TDREGALEPELRLVPTGVVDRDLAVGGVVHPGGEPEREAGREGESGKVAQLVPAANELEAVGEDEGGVRRRQRPRPLDVGGALEHRLRGERGSGREEERETHDRRAHHCTLMVPVIPAWMVQWYSYAPVVSKVWLKSVPFPLMF